MYTHLFLIIIKYYNMASLRISYYNNFKNMLLKKAFNDEVNQVKYHNKYRL